MRSFIKSQFSSVIATSVDFFTTILLREVLGMGYLPAHASGMTAGGITQFTLNRKWTFGGGKNSVRTTAIRYVMAWTLGLILSTAGVWLLTHYLGVNYIISKAIVSVVLSVSVNFHIHKHYVFK